MGKADEFIKRGLIVGLAVTTLGGAVLPINTVYAATNDNAIVSMASSIVINAETEPASLEGIDTTASTKIPSKLIEGNDDTGAPTTTLDGTPVGGMYTSINIEHANNKEKYLGREIATGYDVYEVASGSARGRWQYYKTYIDGDGELVVQSENNTIGNYEYYTYIEAKKSGVQLGYTDTVTGKHVGSTGHITNIDTKEADWEYNAPQYIITDLEMPLSYVNPWYSSGEDKDPAKAVKSYYYLGTVIYNDTTTKSTASGYDSLSDNEKQNYDDIKYYYNQKVKSSSDYNAKAEIVKKGIEFDSTDLPLIYQLLTGEKFDWQYWYNKGFNDAQNYSSYTLGATGSSKVSHGVKSNYAIAITISGYDSKIVQVYKVIKDGEARVYVKGLKQGTTTLTIKTTLNDGKTVSYKTKVTIKASNAPIKYKTEVSPLSYAAYAMEKDGANYLGYLSKNGDFYGSGDTLQTLSHPTYQQADTQMFTTKTARYQRSFPGYVDNSLFMKEFLENCGAFDMLAEGKSEYQVLKHVTDSIHDARVAYYEKTGVVGVQNSGTYLKSYLTGGPNHCDPNATISAGAADLLGINYFQYHDPGIHIETYVILDGKYYMCNAFGFSIRNEFNGSMSVSFPNIKTTHTSLAEVTLAELLSGKLTTKVTGSDEIGAGFFYKIADEYEAGHFKYGANTESGKGQTATIPINNSFGVLTADLGDIRLLTLRAGDDPSWDKDEQNTITFRYAVPYMERAHFTIKKGSTKQLNLVNANWSDWTPKTSSSKIATINSTGKVTMVGAGTATITLTHKTIKGLSIKVLVSTSSFTASTAKKKAGTFYTENDGMYTNGTHNIIAGDYMRIHD